MEIYLVRHTTPNIEKGICYGQSDIGITESFAEEIKEIHKNIPLHEITTVYSSPLQRCKILARSFKKPIIQDARLKEMNFGDWELQAWNDIDQEISAPWMKDFVNVQVPNGESYVMLQKRVLDFYYSLPLSSEEKILIITHAGPMRALLAHIRKIALKDSFDIKIGYGEVLSFFI
ncbi:alpha-ribazole phosphatase [Aquimarina aquimarini]|uniref:alpha-ribazole phosphatase n=1 Tax=Aquimarina aquimarini TaxID=1191734 RepID=UPI000D550D22|nr:alpha-ribazole phosphatase [Aquimarina aquimarini]